MILRKTLSIFPVVLMTAVLLIGCGAPSTTSNGELTYEQFETLKTKLDPALSTGNLIFSGNYNIYCNHIPAHLRATKPEDVGYVLYTSSDYKHALYNGNVTVSGEILTVSLMDDRTDETIATKTFEVTFPEQTTERSIKVDGELVQTWLEHVHPDADPAIHTWQEASCLAPRQCSICDLTQGEALGHDWIPGDCNTQRLCSRCSIAHREIPDHAISQWTFNQDSVYKMEGTCETCGQHVKVQTEWDLMFTTFLTAKHWKIHYVKDEGEERFRQVEAEAYLYAREDGTASVVYEDTVIEYTWRFDHFDSEAEVNKWLYCEFTRVDTGETFIARCLPTSVEQFQVDGYTVSFRRLLPI